MLAELVASQVRAHVRTDGRTDGREVWRFEAHCLPLTILVRHHWPAMMIDDLTGSEKTALNPLWSAP
jgi:hypothetical protein